jgi:ornithine cyclodeaminase/alanine dehydrogenase-like protein (mu-crystallin family)
MSAPPPLRYLAAEDVRAAMPSLDERLRLAEKTLTAFARAGAAELPPKIAIHPRPQGSFAHAMPAHLRGSGDSTAEDLVGMKWIASFATNNAFGLPALSAMVILNDPSTGVPIAVLDGGPITAERTAAVSGMAIRHFAPRVAGRPIRAAIVGAGVQARSHLPVLGHLLPGLEIVLFDRHADRAVTVAELAARTSGVARANAVSLAREAVKGADLVVTTASFGQVRQVMTNEWLVPGALVIAVDYATYCAAEVARDASLFVVDHREQFMANRAAGLFDGYPEPSTTLGEALLSGIARPDGRVVVTHLGVGLADVVFADAITREAERRRLGVVLSR